MERPASAIKELVENSLDAGATDLSVDIEGGGLSLLRVTDNGHGMEREDLELCILRHATSKLRVIDDLFSIASLGFRGEALPSIAAVSHLRIQSRLQGAENGFELLCSGGEVTGLNPVGMPQGTIVEVRDLFYNTPARLKFMKSETSESQRVVQTVERLSFSHPAVRFTLSIDHRIVLQTPGNTNLIDSAVAIYGASTAKQLRLFGPVKGRSISLRGVLGTPALHRNNRAWQSLFLNGRYIEHRGLSFALDEAYRTLLPSKRYPVAILHMEIAADEVDVNVHPTKVEVRFRDERAVIGEAITMLRAQIEAMARGSAEVAASTEVVEPSSSHTPEFRAKPHFTPISPLRFEEPSPREYRPVSAPAPTVREQISIFPAVASYRLIGQVQNSYLLVEKQGKLVVVDQHAAHERVLYEQFARSRGGQVQELAIPISIDFGASAHLVARFLATLLEIGFSLEHFGGSTYLLRSMPRTYKGRFDEEVLKELVAELGAERAVDLHEKVAINLACRAAIKANTRLSPAEMVELLDQLYATNLSITCPHGRPVEIAYSEEDLFRLFHPR